MSKVFIFLIIFIAIFGVLAGLYFFVPDVKSKIDPLISGIFPGQNIETEEQSSSNEGIVNTSGKKISPEEFESLVNRLGVIKSKLDNQAVLKDPRYESLVDFSVPVTAEPQGNTNPFKLRPIKENKRP